MLGHHLSFLSICKLQIVIKLIAIFTCTIQRYQLSFFSLISLLLVGRMGEWEDRARVKRDKLPVITVNGVISFIFNYSKNSTIFSFPFTWIIQMPDWYLSSLALLRSEVYQKASVLGIQAFRRVSPSYSHRLASLIAPQNDFQIKWTRGSPERCRPKWLWQSQFKGSADPAWRFIF